MTARAALLLLFTACGGTGLPNTVQPEPRQGHLLAPPPSLGDGWVTDSPARVGMDPRALRAMVEKIESGEYPNIHSVVIARHGRLVFEAYFSGIDERLDGQTTAVDFDPTTPHDVRSISKSITALLIGIAMDRRLIRDVSEPVDRFFPDHVDQADDWKKRITLEHLLTMRSGLDGDEVELDLSALEGPGRQTPNPFAEVLSRDMIAAPGSEFQYMGGNTTVLGGVLQQVSGKPVDIFAEEVLFRPLGITDYEWMKWQDGTPRVAGGLRLTPRDLARIGQVVVDEGVWRGRRIVSAGWVRSMRRSHVVAPPGIEYGYQWWVRRFQTGGRTVEAATAIGNGGQRLYAIDSLGLVVVITAGNFDDPIAAAALPGRLMREHILPSIGSRERAD